MFHFQYLYSSKQLNKVKKFIYSHCISISMGRIRLIRILAEKNHGIRIRRPGFYHLYFFCCVQNEIGILLHYREKQLCATNCLQSMQNKHKNGNIHMFTQLLIGNKYYKNRENIEEEMQKRK